MTNKKRLSTLRSYITDILDSNKSLNHLIESNIDNILSAAIGSNYTIEYTVDDIISSAIEFLIENDNVRIRISMTVPYNESTGYIMISGRTLSKKTGLILRNGSRVNIYICGYFTKEYPSNGASKEFERVIKYILKNK